MSAYINKTSSVQILSPLENPISSKPSIYSTAKIESRLQDIDCRIKTWKKIASKEHVDITEEDSSLNCIRSVPIKGSEKNVRVFNLLLIEECKGRVCNRIVKKVKSNLSREPDAEKLQALNKELFDLTNKMVIPWIQKAQEEGVDIKEETETMDAADKCSYDRLAERGSNPQHVLEVVQRRLKTLRTQCCMRIITKTYIKRIQDFAEKAKSKDWFDDNRIEIIEGIASDALAALPHQCELTSMQKKSEQVFESFKNNIKLFEEDPVQYMALADREWLRREIIFYSTKLLKICKAKKDLYNVNQLLNAKQIALQLLDTDRTTEDIRETVNKAFDIFAERLCGVSKMGGCGFLASDGRSYNRDNDPSA